MNNLRRLVFVACCLLPVAFLSAATPPALVNYQGVLRDGTGAPQAGSFDIIFRFYDLDTAGTLLLTDTHNAAAPSGQVIVSNGLFTAQLGGGTITAGSEPNLTEVFRDNAAVWLEIQVGAETLSPRVRVLASAYALNAATLQGSVNVDASGGVEIVKTSEGNNLVVASPGYVEVDLQNSSDEPGQFNLINFRHGNDGRAALASYVPGGGDVDLLFMTTDAGVGGLPMALTGNGNLGVGTIAPDWRLDVSGDVRVSGAFRDSSADAGTSGQVLQSTGTGTNWVSPSTLNDGDWTISGSNLYSAVSGNVGIGTQAPTAKLQVIGPLEVQTYSDETLDQSQTSHVGQYGGTINWQSFTAGITGKLTRVEFYSRSPLTSGSPVAATLDIRAGQGTGGALLASQSFLITQDVYVWQSIPFSAPPDVLLGNQYTLIFTVASVDRQWWRESNTNPYSGGEGSPGSWCDFAFNTYCSTQIGPTLYSAINGRVGIGTTTPTSMLDVVGDARLSGAFRDSSGDPGSSGQVLSSTGAATAWVSPSTLSDGDWIVNGSDMYSAVSGNVGIGTAAPTLPLTIQGTGVNSELVQFKDSTGTNQWHVNLRNGGLNVAETGVADNRLYIDAGGNVGIGTDAPTEKLTVKGNLNVFNASAAQRAWMGVNADGAGEIALTGANGNDKVRLHTATGDGNRGAVDVYDSAGSTQCGMYVDVSGNGIVWGDTKNFRKANPRNSQTEIWYASIEGPEAAAYLRGTARLESGRAAIAFPEHFQDIAVAEGMTVQLTPSSGESLGLWVESKGLMGMTIRELGGGKGTYLFDWEVKAVREGHEAYQVIRPRMGTPAEQGITADAVLSAKPLPPADTPPRTTAPRPMAEAGPAATSGEPLHPADSGPDRIFGPTAQMMPVMNNVEPGDVLVLNPANGDELYPCNLPADPMVVGVAAGAEFGVQSSEFGDGVGGAQLPAASYQLPGGGVVPVVMGGVTFVKADATLAPIAKGDLLTTSATPGHAMKAVDPRMGTVVGKALEDLPAGTGMIRVVVMLR